MCVCVRAIESEFSDGVENHNCFLSSCVCVYVTEFAMVRVIIIMIIIF